ncbi:hypothetical protein [Dactylosporangium sp. CA-139066]|uniref:hypothetical protein n=1 Tax=Dactylosporangium sp. CA-139066 TaxID=3239930 RepID=UPI003D8CF93F
MSISVGGPELATGAVVDCRMLWTRHDLEHTVIHPTIGCSRRETGVVDGPAVGPVIQWLRCRLDDSGVLHAGRWAASFNTDMTRFVADMWRIVVKKTTNALVRAGSIDGPVCRNAAERRFHVGQHAMALATSGVITLASNRMRLQRRHERQAHRPAGSPAHHGREHAVPGMVVHSGDDLRLGAAGEHHPADDVHLPQLHRPVPLPTGVVLPTPTTRHRVDQAVADQQSADCAQ